MQIVQASGVRDYLDKYYKKARYIGRGAEYAAALLKSYEAEYEKFGYVCTSRFDNVTGECIAWPTYPTAF
uniref:Uncharacterized protein n=1 Tax=viral metagenome TaxID=1070528 RepID=A0A6H1ZWL9_9ZZZZ